MSKRRKKRTHLPAQQQQGQAVSPRSGQSITFEGHYSGPLPPPGMVRGLEEIQPGFLNRWMQTIEKEQAHEHALSNKILEIQGTLEKRGQICALGIGVLGVGGGIYLFLTGHDVGGGILVGTTLVSLVTAFLKSQGPASPEQDQEDEG